MVYSSFFCEGIWYQLLKGLSSWHVSYIIKLRIKKSEVNADYCCTLTTLWFVTYLLFRGLFQNLPTLQAERSNTFWEGWNPDLASTCELWVASMSKAGEKGTFLHIPLACVGRWPLILQISPTRGLIAPVGEGGSVPSDGKWRLREMNTKAPLSTTVQY